METFRDPSALATVLSDVDSPITIDGFHGAGKSRLGKVLATRLGRPLIELDVYLRNGEGRFVEALRFQELAGTIAAAARPVILEGICVLKVAEKLGLRAITVYVRKLEREGMWLREQYLDLERGAEALIEDIREKDRLAALHEEPEDDGSEEGLLFEVIRYHHEYRPHLSSDYYFDRVA